MDLILPKKYFKDFFSNIWQQQKIISIFATQNKFLKQKHATHTITY